MSIENIRVYYIEAIIALERLKVAIDGNHADSKAVIDSIDGTKNKVDLLPDWAQFPQKVTIEVWGYCLNAPHFETADTLLDALEQTAAFLYDDVGITYPHLKSARDTMWLLNESSTATDNRGLEYRIIKETP